MFKATVVANIVSIPPYCRQLTTLYSTHIQEKKFCNSSLIIKYLKSLPPPSPPPNKIGKRGRGREK